MTAFVISLIVYLSLVKSQEENNEDYNDEDVETGDQDQNAMTAFLKHGHILSIILAVIMVTITAFLIYFAYKLLQYFNSIPQAIHTDNNKQRRIRILNETDDESNTLQSNDDEKNSIHISENTPLLDTI